MPETKLPYVPFPTERPRMVPTPSIHETVPELRISNAVGEALKEVGKGYGTLGGAYSAAGDSWNKLGVSFKGAGQELFERANAIQELNNAKIVDQATLKHDQSITGILEDYRTKMGEQAGGAEGLQTVNKQMEDKRNEIRETLPNEQAKKDYDSQTRGYQGTAIRGAGLHAAQQFKNAARGSADATADMYKDRAANSDSEQEFAENIGRLTETINGKLRYTSGWTEEEAAEEVRKRVGEAVTAKAMRVGETDPTRGLNILEENSKKIPAKLYEQAHNSLINNQRRIEARNIGDNANSNPDAPLEDKVKKAEDEAQRIRPGDPVLKHDAVMAAKTVHDIKQKEDRETLQRNIQTVTDAIRGYSNPEGKLPTKPEDLKVNKEDYAAYMALKPTERAKMDRVLSQNAKGDYPMTPETARRAGDLWGVSLSDPYRFKDLDIYAEHIPWSDRNKLIDLQHKIQKEGVKAAEDPQVSHAMQILHGGDALPAEILKPGNPELKAQYMGALRQALLVAQQQPNRTGPLNPKEIIEVGRSVRKEMTEGGLFGGGGFLGTGLGRQQIWETVKDITPEFRQKYMEQYPHATEEQLADEYAKYIWVKEFQKYHSGQPTEKSTIQGGPGAK